MGVISSAIEAVGGMASAGIANAGAKNRQREAQEYNKELAEWQNSMNLEQWHRENAYNDPGAQMERYIKAGMNPNLVTGQQNLSANSPTLTSGAPTSPAPFNMPSMGEITNAVNQGMLLDAQIRNIDADTDLKKSGSDLNTANINFIKGAQTDLTEAQTDHIKADIEQIDQNISNMKKDAKKVEAMTKYIDAQTLGQEIKNYFEAPAQRAMIQKLQAETGLTKAQTQECLTLMTAKLCNINMDTDLKFEQQKLASMNFKNGKFDLEYKGEMKEWNQDMQKTEQVIGAVGGAVGTIVSGFVGGVAAKGLFKHLPKIGFKKGGYGK